jgi:hypothetical protein
MVGNPGRTADPRRIRRLKAPAEIEVEADGDGVPRRLRLGSGGWREVALVRRPWRVDQHWWREQSASRLYYRVAPEDAPPVTIYLDLENGRWFRQEYG